MNRFLAASLAACALLLQASVSVGNTDDEDDKPAAAGDQTPDLTARQQKAVGIVVAHPVAAKLPERIAAVGLVLDATMLISDSGEVAGAQAAEQSAAAELARLRALHQGGAGASLKQLEAAQAEHAKLRAQAQLATARMALHWGPVADAAPAAREKIVADATRGRSLLVRAELPGRHTLSVMPQKALLDVDGIQVPGRALGVLRETTETQSIGLLIEVPNAPAGLGPGARVPVTLSSAVRSGFLLPRDAVLYDEQGPYVFKQSERKNPKAADKTSFVPVKVKLLAAAGSDWLTEGLDDDDEVVVQGAGVLWSLQGMAGRVPDDDDD
jgi:hypothetical protein